MTSHKDVEDAVYHEEPTAMPTGDPVVPLNRADFGPVESAPQDLALIEAATSSEPPSGERGRTLLKGASWQLLAQLAPLVVNLALTPFVIRTLGEIAYGFFLLASTLTQFLAQFDGGIGRSASRYFAVYAGARDRIATTRLLVSLLLCITGITGISLGIVFIYAPQVMDFFHAPPQLRSDTVFLLRVLTVMVGLALARNLFAAILNANHRFALTASTILGGYVIYAVGTVFVLSRGMGLYGLALVFIAQQTLGTFTIIPSTLRYLTRSGLRLLSGREIKDFFLFAWKVQLSSLLNLVGLQGATLIVGRLAPAALPQFGPGSTFAQQLRMIPMNALLPIQSMLGGSIGARGAQETKRTFIQVQRVWVLAVCGWIAVGAPAAYFGVNAWLPLSNNTAGMVAALLLVAHLFALLLDPLRVWAMLLHRPEFEMRNGMITVVLTLGLSLGLVPLLGALGVAVAMLVAQVVAFFYMQTAARRLQVPVPSPVQDIPWGRMLLAAAESAACTWAMSQLLHAIAFPRSGTGLLLCGLAAAPAFLMYIAMTTGIRPALALVKNRGRS